MPRTDDNLRDGLAMVDALITMEAGYADPPTLADKYSVTALRAASIILLVSTFEEYLKQRTQDAVKYLNSFLHDREVYDFKKLPNKLQINHYHLTVKFAAEGNKFDGLKKEDRIPYILRAAVEIQALKLDPTAFSQTHSNPNSQTVKQLFSDLGRQNQFPFLTDVYQRVNTTSIALVYLETTLDSLVANRNNASHAISTMNISRQDVAAYRRFIENFCKCINTAYSEHCDEILEAAKV